MKRRFAILLVLTACLIGFARAEIPDGFYQPQEYSDNDYSNPDSRWCFARSSESAHFIAFGKAGFGEDPSNVSENMRVDIADLLEKAETFYQTNVSPGMADALPFGRKIQIYLDVYFIVLGAPEEHVCHIWDNDESTDAQMPFEIQIEYEG